MSKKPEKHAFQAEVQQVLSLVVNSLYTHREIFLRELVSNASDALDHLSFRALTEPDLLGDDSELHVEIAADKEARTLTLSDNGVGMSHDELIQNLGTIAHSGTRKLAETIGNNAESADGEMSLIGQFGVGFYSAFLVAQRVEVVSRAAGGDEAWKWESDAAGEFTITPSERATRGTDIVLHLKDDKDLDDFLHEWSLRELVRKYSDYVRHPIRLRVERTKGEGDDQETVVEWEQINRAAALWRRSKSDVTEEQVHEFYKHLTHDWEPPAAYNHFKVEGMQELSGLLFAPGRAPMDLFTRKNTGIRLFVKRVFIMDDCEELLPDYLRFVRGVVDSEDLPLNVSREFLQRDRTTAAIRKQVVRHTLTMLEDLAASDMPASAGDDAQESENDDDASPAETTHPYHRFWRAFGAVLKEGMHSDAANRDRLSKLLRYESSAVDGLTSLDEYIERMPEGQESIYYVLAQSRAAAAGSPHLEALRARGYEVLYMTDHVDEWVVDGFREYADKPLVAAGKGAFDLPETDEEKEKREERADALEPLLEKMKGVLTETVSDVRVTTRLTDSPACLVVDEGGVSPHVERLLRTQAVDAPIQKRILEVNPSHPVIERIAAASADSERADEVEEWTHLLYDQALVAEGSPPSDPSGFARRITRLLERAVT